MSYPNIPDLVTTNNPLDVARFLRRIAEKYRADAAELRAAWQDPKAGMVWDKLAEELEKSAVRCEKAVEKHFV